ncbi:MAG: 2-succinyl-5-enolpyruvyl-6-hydroxy-3-cyclohexene-1-carboxylic-acid synthase [Actinobacteria bacterium]|nr:2-succinyl-5-enolpyruvyl-6-hydroxy-3-cyclohexene-1-carboxylic-acid synthase [Actinomycetota bacterium]
MTTAAANPSHALALVVVDELARCGVTDAVLAPGSRSTALALALADDPRVRLHVQIDERSAGFVAVGLGRATGRPAAVVTTSGSATANLHPAVVEADTGHVPVLVLTTDRPPELRHTASNQTIDQLGLYGPAVRWFCEVGVPEDRPGVVAYWRSTLARAYAEATGVRTSPGPVHLNLAFREPTVPETDDGRSRVDHPFRQDLSGRTGGAAWVTTTRPPAELPPDQLAALAERIAGTERGLVVLGDVGSDVAPALDLAERAGWPVVAEPLSDARRDGRALTHAAQLTAVPAFAAAHRPDLVLRIGRTGLARGVAELLGPDVPQLLVDPYGRWLDPHRAVAELVVADPARTCAGVAEVLAAPAGSAWLDDWRRADGTAAAAVAAVLEEDDTPSEPRAARDVAAAVPDGGALVVGSSMPIRDLDGYLRPRRGLRILGNRGASGIDGFVSTALGVALASSGPTVALCGDLTFLHDGNGFLLRPDVAAVDCTFVVVDNDGGGIFSFLPQARYPAAFERVFATPHGRDLAGLAAFHGLPHERVTSATALPAAVAAAAGAGGIRVLEVRTDRDANVALHRRLQDAVAAAV